jgi:drug/metabolite transporter (DMT)-like permease
MIRHFPKTLLGKAAVFGSTFCFYTSTVFARWAKTEGMAISSEFFVFCRFLAGFLLMVVIFLLKREHPRPRQHHYLLGRAIGNTLAVFCLYKAIELTTVAQANILNMTYPIFIALFSWFLWRTQRNVMEFVMTFVAFAGIVLMLSPGEMRFEWNSMWGLASGITSAFSILCLKFAREKNDTETVLLIMFGLGAALLLLGFYYKFHWPNGRESLYLFAVGIMGVAGQYLLTLGYRHVSAVEGGIISSFIIFLAAILGPIVTSDPNLTLWGWIGASIIFGTDLYFIVRKSA